MPSRPTWFDSVADRLGHAPPVIETEDVRRDPRGALTALCAAIDLDFTDAMLSWPQGQHPDDGAWAPHWYGAIFATTGFAPPEEKAPDLPGTSAGDRGRGTAVL